MSDKTRFEKKDEKIGRKGYLKGLVAGLLGTAVLLKLKDIPKVNAVNTFLKLGDSELPDYNYNTSTTGIGSNNTGGTLFANNTSSGPGIVGQSTSGHGVKGQTDTFIGVMGEATTSGSGVIGVTEGTVGILKNAGVHGLATSAPGAIGESTSGNGVEGYSNSGYGVLGKSQSTSTPFSQGVVGITENLPPPLLEGAFGVQGVAATGNGVVGSSNSGVGVSGISMSGTAIDAVVLGAAGKPLVARGWLGQTANLQEWQNVLGTPLTVVDKDGRIGVGINTPTANVHGLHTNTSEAGIGIQGETQSVTNGATGVYGFHNATSGAGIGVKGESDSPSGHGVYGVTADGVGVLAETTGYGWALSVKGKSKIGGWVIPTMDNKFKLGYGKKRWKAVHAVDFLTTSLSQFKENIEQPSDIEYLESVPEPIYFNWRDSDDKEKRLGFMGDYLPEIARDSDGGIYTSSVTAILCGAIKQLKEENEDLRKRVEQLEKNN